MLNMKVISKSKDGRSAEVIIIRGEEKKTSETLHLKKNIKGEWQDADNNIYEL